MPCSHRSGSATRVFGSALSCDHVVDPTPHLALVHHIANRVYAGLAPASRVQYDDLISAGTEGLLRGAARADDGPGLSSWLGRYIWGSMTSEIRRAIRDLEPTVERAPLDWYERPPPLADRILARVHAQLLVRDIMDSCTRRERIILWASYGLGMTLDEMAPHLQLTPPRIATLRAALLRRLRTQFRGL